MIYSADERAIIWLDGFLGLSKEQKLKMIAAVKSPSALLEDITLLEQFVGDTVAQTVYSAVRSSLNAGFDNTVLRELEELGVTAVTCMSDNYPDCFLTIPDPPLVIYCIGDLELLSERNRFTIVGSRKTLAPMISLAEDYAKQLAESGVVIVTGLAEGVDSAVIKGALPTGNIISVLPGGFKHIYPEFNKSLFNKIKENGLVISEYPPDAVSKAYHFPERNRLLAALSKGVLICSAGKKSGTSYTADFANEYGKDVFAFPYTIGVPSGEGCNAMIKEYAMLCDSVEDIFTSFGISPKKQEAKLDLSEREKKVFSCIKEGEIHIDLLLQKTGYKIFEISPVLTMLEIKKLIVKNPGNTYTAIK